MMWQFFFFFSSVDSSRDHSVFSHLHDYSNDVPSVEQPWFTLLKASSLWKTLVNSPLICSPPPWSLPWFLPKENLFPFSAPASCICLYSVFLMLWHWLVYLSFPLLLLCCCNSSDTSRSEAPATHWHRDKALLLLVFALQL